MTMNRGKAHITVYLKTARGVPKVANYNQGYRINRFLRTCSLSVMFDEMVTDMIRFIITMGLSGHNLYLLVGRSEYEYST